MGKGGKIAMIIIGAVLLIIGIYMLVTWNGINAAAELGCALFTGLAKELCISTAAAAGNIYLIPGIILLAVGAILLLVGLLKLKSA